VIRRALALCGLTALALLAAAPGAIAHGIGGLVRDVASGAHLSYVPMARAAGLSWGDGPVLHSNRTHVVFWMPSGSTLAYDRGYQQLVVRFLSQVAADSHHATNVYGLSGQYSDTGGPAAYDSSFDGAVVATDVLPPNQCVEPVSTGPEGWITCLTDAQLQSELKTVVSADHLPRAANDIYFLVLPDGMGTCIDSTSSACALGGSSNNGYCGYHSQTDSGLLYAVIPYNAVSGHCQSGNPRPNASSADPALSTISHEHNETVTDPQAYSGWTDGNLQEDGDLCITQFGPALGGGGDSAFNETIAGGHYYLQEEWSNENGGCAPRDETDPVSFAGPGRVSAGRAFSVTGHAFDPDGRIVAWAWHYGDGSPGSHARASTHAYRHAGVYHVLLRVADSAGNWATSTRTVHVATASARQRSARPVTPKHHLVTRRG
jgi:hypothetical protein